jgi:hypothetical protein
MTEQTAIPAGNPVLPSIQDLRIRAEKLAGALYGLRNLIADGEAHAYDVADVMKAYADALCDDLERLEEAKK